MFIVLVNDSDFGTVILCFPSKVSKYGVFSGPYFPVFGLNTGKYVPEKNSVFRHFSLRVQNPTSH